ncbi:hypothetical protein D3C79_794270 [compost metagenome]
MNAHRFKVGSHAPANSPHLFHLGIAQHPISLERICDVDHAAGLGLQALGRVIGQLGQGLCAGDPNPHWYAGALENPGPQLSPELSKVFLNTGQISEALVDAVDLGGRHHRLDQRHDTLAHVAVKRVITAKGHDAVPT